MGPYYLTALVQLLGPARRIGAMGGTARAQREITSEPLAGEMIDVEVPTHVSSAIEFASGAIATLVTSFDVQVSRYRCIEVYGTEATLSVPDPNTFGGPVSIRRQGDDEWTEVELLDAHLPQFRGIGFADMLWAQRTGRPHRASAELALHVLELMTAAITSSETGRVVELETTCERARAAAGRPARRTPTTTSGTMETLRYGIVGAGFVSQFHLRALEAVRGVEVAGLTSRTAPHELAESVRARGLGEARVFDSVREMAQHVDVVAIFNPNFLPRRRDGGDRGTRCATAPSCRD